MTGLSAPRTPASCTRPSVTSSCLCRHVPMLWLRHGSITGSPSCPSETASNAGVGGPKNLNPSPSIHHPGSGRHMADLLHLPMTGHAGRAYCGRRADRTTTDHHSATCPDCQAARRADLQEKRR